MAKKSFNPFKIWGSYIGIVAIYLTDWVTKGNISFWIREIYYKIFPAQTVDNTVSAMFTSFVILIIAGFLIGYGIHSWIRKARS